MTPIQELIEIIKQRINDDDAMPFMWNEQIIELAQSMLDKEKEAMCEFAEYVRKCGQQSDHRGLMTNEELFEETFNTK
jgi:hypothetical protein